MRRSCARGWACFPGFLDVIDDAVVAHLGFYRDPQTLQPVPYYANVPDDLSERHVFILDPMLATGNSGAAAIDALASRGAAQITFVSLIAAPEGVRTIHAAHPTVRIVTGSARRAPERPWLHRARLSAMPEIGCSADRARVPVAVRPRQ